MRIDRYLGAWYVVQIDQILGNFTLIKGWGNTSVYFHVVFDTKDLFITP